MAVTGLIPNVASAWPVLMVSYLPVILISGAFGSVTGEPHWLVRLASYLPAEPVIDATTRAAVPGGREPVLRARRDRACLLAGRRPGCRTAAVPLAAGRHR